MTLKIKTYGWKPDLPDHRDYRFKLVRLALPKHIDLRKYCPPVLDQGELGSCTANAIANHHRFVQTKQGAPGISPSRLFIYYNERLMEGTVGEDSGAMIRDGFKSIATQGVCDEAEWPYVISKFTRKPTQKCYMTGVQHQAIEYRRLDNTNLTELKQCLAEGYPFVFGFSVYSDFESERVATTGLVRLPKDGEQLLGGHAVLCVGYSDYTNRFIVQNSWGTNWGKNGYFTIPYSYLTNPNLSDDFWTLRSTK